jgi:hypothetical protein
MSASYRRSASFEQAAREQLMLLNEFNISGGCCTIGELNHCRLAIKKPVTY